ncbi:hypothetical protein KFK09_010132 [Dendrobium nobile]|uniref:Uncharacterized protein n=1 Tax=Dendrobium nobile TaxID=94219 RepID=A0A8T3BLP9_DENNO|nr:hypothetical protein KFK09_010132 [Dendrobium nobile]
MRIVCNLHDELLSYSLKSPFHRDYCHESNVMIQEELHVKVRGQFIHKSPLVYLTSLTSSFLTITRTLMS